VIRTVRSGPSEVRLELWSDSEFGLLGRTFGSEFWVGVWGGYTVMHSYVAVVTKYGIQVEIRIRDLDLRFGRRSG
jgi:hypothetical protein